MSDSIFFYEQHAGRLAALYETASSEALYDWIKPQLPFGPGLLALDVGAGSGRDAAWLAGLGFEVVAAEPAMEMRLEGQRRHSGASITWVDDRLPSLEKLHRDALAFDLILLSGVWMHIPPDDRARAFRKTVSLLKPGGTIVMSFRDGPAEEGRPIWAASIGEVEHLARAYGLLVVKINQSADQLGRADIRWTSLCLRLPDDGIGAFPLLRGIILQDEKSSTYKLGLLRALTRVADAMPALALMRDDGDVFDLPLGAVAMAWVRQYLPLVAAGLPQVPKANGADGLGFAKKGFRWLLGRAFEARRLKPGAVFQGDEAYAVFRALRESSDTIHNMPATFIRYPGSDRQVFETRRGGTVRARSAVALDRELMWSLGTISVPGHVWRTMQRYSAWIEPVLVAEWSRLVRQYSGKVPRDVHIGEVEVALSWQDPGRRDTAVAREVARKLLGRGEEIRCVWTGRRLSMKQLDIDHCLPWSVWPTDDLWNLVPSSRKVNLIKGGRLPAREVLAAAKPAVLDWWGRAWMADPVLASRFSRESEAAFSLDQTTPEAIFAGLEWRRLRLRHEQQVPEWAGSRLVRSFLDRSRR